MRKLFLVTIGFLALYSCEKEIPLDAEQSDSRLVFNSIFSANDTIFVNLSKSKSILDEQYVDPSITGAIITLLDANGNLLATAEEVGLGNYFIADVLPEVGKTYELRAVKSGFENISATSYTPSIISIASLDTMTAANGDFDFTFNINDPASESNYYGISMIAYYRIIDEFSMDTFYWEVPYYTTQEVYIDNGTQDIDGQTYDSEFFFSDKTFNGTSFSFKGSKYAEDWEGPELLYYVAVVRSMSEDLYKYKISYQKYSETQGNFFAEPVRVYSNVENGFGIFGGASEYRDTLWVE